MGVKIELSVFCRFGCKDLAVADPVWFPPVLGRRSGSARALRSTGVSEKQRASLGTLKNRTKGLAWGSVLSVAFSLSLWCPFLSETEA